MQKIQKHTFCVSTVIDADRALEIVSFSNFFSLVLLIRVLTSRNFRVRSVAWSPDGKQIASGSWDSSVDWQSPDCESQILMVSSTLPLAICFLSGLHATERSLQL